MLKHGEYRSASQYVYTMKRWHIREGYRLPLRLTFRATGVPEELRARHGAVDASSATLFDTVLGGGQHEASGVTGRS